jgi:hypothetical protein
MATMVTGLALCATACGGSQSEPESPEPAGEEGPIEEAGELVDETAEEAADETGEAMKDVGEEMDDDATTEENY